MITIIVTTYIPDENSKRAQYLTQTVQALAMYLDNPSYAQLILADDGSPSLAHVQAIAQQYMHTFYKTYITTTKHEGIGASLNLALRDVETPWMYMTDDWVLKAPLDLTVPMELLKHYDYVRVGATHPSLHCVTRFQQGLGWWLEIEQARGGYAFATRPFIATKAFYNKVGPFVEQSDSYVTETDYALRVAGNPKLKLAQWGPIEGLFEHIGEECVGYKFP